MTKPRSTTNLAADIQTLAIAISKAGVRQVMVDYAGHVDLFTIKVYPAGTKWGQGASVADLNKDMELESRVWLNEPHEQVTTSLLIIRDRLDELMLEIPEPREVA